jgi:hypothetical protein
MDAATPIFEFEVRYFRNILKISYETGCRMRSRGILTPDAFTCDNRSLYLVSPKSIQKAKERINQYRAVWAYVAIAFWGPAGEDLTIDIVIDPYSKAKRGEIILTGGFYCDVAVRFPQLFCYSQANAAGP